MFRSSLPAWMRRRVPASLPFRLVVNWFLPRLEVLEDRALPSIFLNGDPNWTSVGPVAISEPGIGNDIGAVNQIAVNPNNANEAFAATTSGGIWETGDVRNTVGRDSSGVPISDQISSNNGTLAITEFYHVAYDSLNNVVFGGAQDNGSPDLINGQWTDDTPGVDGGQVAVVNSGSTSEHFTSSGNLDPWNENILTGTDQLAQGTISIQPAINDTGGLMLRQAVFGIQNQPPIDLSPSPFAGGADGYPFVIDAVAPQRILVGTNHLYESFDGGNTLTELGGVIPPQNGQPPVLLGAVGTSDAPAYNGVSALAYGGMLNGQPEPDVV